jgi:hypothetical protein
MLALVRHWRIHVRQWGGAGSDSPLKNVLGDWDWQFGLRLGVGVLNMVGEGMES